MDHDSPHVLDLSQALHDTIQCTVVVWPKEDTCGVEPLVDCVDVQAGAQEVLPE